MTDTAAKPIRVQTDTISGTISWIDLPADQLDRVQAILDAGNVAYWVDHMRVSFNGGPYMTKIHLRRKADPQHAQSVLDAAN